MLISVINRSKKISDEEVQNVIRVINRQIAEDFEPYWSFGATLRLEGSIGPANHKNLSDLRGDAILYLYDKANVDGALGYHDTNWRGIPYGFVFVELAEQLGESWTVTLSHEALELIGDAQANLLVQGPHPEDPKREVFHWFEMCDAVQSESYKIEGIAVSNFVLPTYFTVSDEPGTRNDYLGRKDHNGKSLASFGVKPGGYVGFYDPASKTSEQWAAPEDTQARKRMAIKGSVESGRGYMRKNSQATISNEKRHRASLHQTADATLKAAAPGKPAFQNDRNSFSHVFVLMLENRSFDQMLGSLNKVGIKVDGVNSSRFNTDKNGKPFYQAPGAADRLPAKGTDPGHEFNETAEQLANGAMNGFIKNFESVCQKRGVDSAAIEQYKPQIMRYFDSNTDAAQDALPVLHTLARNFVICDKWFSSLPGPTWPNRAFVHSGTSHGVTEMPEDLSTIHDFRFYPQATIYNKLSAADVDWCIYHAGISQTVIFPRLWKYLPTRHIRDFDDFEDDLKQSVNQIPQYVFIEPDYFGEDRTDQHPPGSVEAGERLIAKVYDAIRANDDLWNNSLLVIVWDEHGGFYDHVTPGKTVAPDDCGDEKDFQQLGVRVPALLISPRLRAGVSSTIFDHTSLLRYISDRWSLPQMGARAAQANSLEQAFLWSDHLRGANETPSNLSARAKPIQPNAPEAPAPKLAATGRGMKAAPKIAEDLNNLDANGRSMLLAVQAAAAQIKKEQQRDQKLAAAKLRSAKTPGRVAVAAKALSPQEGKALFAELRGKTSAAEKTARKPVKKVPPIKKPLRAEKSSFKKAAPKKK
ncbi:MAG TPA: alkaline phosphatase family protein [Pseudomonadales bacterium]|nr:alkaline phosphatase family protein [Pseudomonadales bacterium]